MAARRHAVATQRFAARRRSAKMDELVACIERLGCVQIDSISVVDRSQRLVLAAAAAASRSAPTTRSCARAACSSTGPTRPASCRCATSRTSGCRSAAQVPTAAYYGLAKAAIEQQITAIIGAPYTLNNVLVTTVGKS